MKSEVKAVLRRDLTLAAIMLGTGLLGGGITAVPALPYVAATIGVLLALSAYAGEHDLVPGLYPEVVTMATFVLAFLAGVAFVFLLSSPVDVVAAAALTGGGVGYGLYRTVFGVIRPVPSYRLDAERGVDPEAPGEDL
jgi:hypothetical protein